MVARDAAAKAGEERHGGDEKDSYVALGLYEKQVKKKSEYEGFQSL